MISLIRFKESKGLKSETEFNKFIKNIRSSTKATEILLK